MAPAKSDRPPNPAAPHEKDHGTRSSSRLAPAGSAQSDAPPSSTSPGPSTAAHVDLETPKANKKATKPARERNARSSSSPPHIGESSPNVTSTKSTEPSRDASPAPVESAPKSPSEFSPGAAQTLCVRLPSSKDSDHRYEIDITIGLRRRAAPQFTGAADKLADNGEDAKSSAGPSEDKQSTIVLVEVPLILDIKTGRKSLGALLNIPDGPIQGWIGSLAKELGKSIAETLKPNIDAAPSVKGKGKDRACTPLPPPRPTPAFYGKAFRTESDAPTTDDNSPVVNDASSPVASSSRVTLDMLSKKRPADEDEVDLKPTKKAKATSSSSKSNTAGSSSSSPPTSVNESVATEADTSSPVASSSRVTLDMLSKKRPAEEDEDVSTPLKKPKVTSSSSEGGSSSSSPPTSIQSSGGSTKINPLGGFAQFSATPATFPSAEGITHGSRASAAFAGKGKAAEQPREHRSRSRRDAGARDKARASKGDYIDLSLSDEEEDHGRQDASVRASHSHSHSRKSAKGKRASRRDVDAADDADERPIRDLPARARSKSEKKARAEYASGKDDEPARESRSHSSRKGKRASAAPRDVDAADDADERPIRNLPARARTKSKKKARAEYASDEDDGEPALESRSHSSHKGKRASAAPRDADSADDANERPLRNLPARARSKPKKKARAEYAIDEDDHGRAVVASTSRRAPSPTEGARD
ncbi:hypothetical protein JCM10450v2_003217 [Rhodotorula kratochvilovae]